MSSSESPRRALITGVTGQDGSYLCELLLGLGYTVHGLVRRSATPNTENIQHLLSDPEVFNRRFFVHVGDVCDPLALHRVVDRVRPHEVYNLAAQSRVDISFEVPHQTLATNLLGTQSLLDAIRAVDPTTRMYQASSSEMFGQVHEDPQREQTPFHPRSPYAVSKVAAFWACVNHRESYGLYVCNGVLFNHESPRRGRAFVTRKIAQAVARVALGLQQELHLGNLDAQRDWGWAPEYVEAMWLMLQQPTPDDYVVATGQSRSVREFLAAAAARVGLDWRSFTVYDPTLCRPAEVDRLRGDASKARERLGWAPRVGFEELVGRMVDAELARLSPGR